MVVIVAAPSSDAAAAAAATARSGRTRMEVVERGRRRLVLPTDVLNVEFTNIQIVSLTAIIYKFCDGTWNDEKPHLTEVRRALLCKLKCDTWCRSNFLGFN